MKLEILKAEYGMGAETKDVTAILRRYARNYRVIFLPSANYNEAFGGDPAPQRRQAPEGPLSRQRQGGRGNIERERHRGLAAAKVAFVHSTLVKPEGGMP